MKISEYDLVRVIAEIPADRIDRSASQGHPQIGDLGAVVLLHSVKPNEEPAFIVECVGSDGHTIWLADILASELEWVPSNPGGA